MAQTVIGQVPEPVQEERAMDKVYRHSIVESHYTPHTSLLSFVSGSPTLVEWYRGSYGTDEEQHAFTPNSIETYSSYKRIRNLIVKLDDGNGSFNFDQTNAQSELTYTGYVIFDLTPNKGDLFIKDIGDGRAGLFKLTEQPEIRSIAADKCYYFEAKLFGVVTEEIENNLNSKVIEDLYYSKDIAVAGGNAVLTKDDTQLNKKLYDFQLAIMDEILGNHFFSDENTIIIPNEKNDYLYDPYLAKFLSYTFPVKLLGSRNKIELLNVNYWVDSGKMQEPLTVWDMFYRNGFDHPKRFKQDYFVHNRNEMMNTRGYGNVYYSKMDRVIVIHKPSAMGQAYDFKGGLLPQGVYTPHPSAEGEDYPYYFSKEFYEGGGTEQEQFIWKMFKDKTIGKKELVDILEKFWDLEPVDKLYMSGIYVGACKTALVTSSAYV